MSRRPSFVMASAVSSTTGASRSSPLLSATPILCASFLRIGARLTNIIIIFVGQETQDEDARFINMQVLLEKSSIFTEVLKDQMDRTREKHAAVTVTTQNRPTKTKPKQRARQSGRCASGRGKRAHAGSDDERDSEDEGEEPPKRVKVLTNDAKPAFFQPALVTGTSWRASLGWSACGRTAFQAF